MVARDDLNRQLDKLYFNLFLAYANGIMMGLKLLYRLGPKSLKVFIDKERDLFRLYGSTGQYIVKGLGILDSVIEFSKATRSLNRGNTGSGFYYIAASLGLLQAVGALSWVPFWGQLALVFTLMYLMSRHDDGSGWDGMEKWLNCCCFGRFDHNDRYLPFPMTDTGLYLSVILTKNFIKFSVLFCQHCQIRLVILGCYFN